MSRKSLCTQNGPVIFGSPFKVPLFPRGKFWFWVGGLAWGVWVRQISPPLPLTHITQRHTDA